MPKTDINRPPTCITVHYSDFEVITERIRPIVQTYCKQLQEKGIGGQQLPRGSQLWIYDNRDINFEYLPDQIIPSIKQAAEHAAYNYQQMGIHYGKTKKQLWGTISKYERIS